MRYAQVPLLLLAGCGDASAPTPACVQREDTMYVIVTDTSGSYFEEKPVIVKRPCADSSASAG